MTRFPAKYLQGFPGAPAQIGQKLPVIQEVSAQHLRDAKDKMPVGDPLQDIRAEPFAELHHLFYFKQAGRSKDSDKLYFSSNLPSQLLSLIT